MSAHVCNSVGSDMSSATISIEDVPDAPKGEPQVYDVTSCSVSLSWVGPAVCEGSIVAYYVIEAKTRHQRTWDVIVPQCKALYEHILNLHPCTTYQFRVRAANKHGLSAPSEPSTRITTVDCNQAVDDDFSDDDLPFTPRDVTMKTTEKFEDFYDLGKEVGKGKFGVVHMCTEKENGRSWAAKMLKVREKDKDVVRQEVAVMNKLRHPKLLLLWDAFETPRRIVLVMEYIGAGELFERVIGDDFVLTERDCIHFLRQICEGVAYMHQNCVLHLDLKPENILCTNENSNRIKIIDFGLARFYKDGESAKVMVGTPEFVAPEVINYDEISFGTDMWSIGVICYILISGLSPFLGDNDAETLANVTSGEYDYDDEAFDEISEEATDFMTKLLVKRKEKRMLTSECLSHDWLSRDEAEGMRYKRLNTERLRRFMVRRKWLKTGNAVLAISRMLKSSSLLTLSRSTSTSSTQSLNSPTNTPRNPFSQDSLDESTSEREPTPVSPMSSSANNNDSQKPLSNGIRIISQNSGKENIKDLVDSVHSNTVSGVSNLKSNVSDSLPLKEDINTVCEAPVFVSSMKDCQVCSGDAVRFDVSVTGNPLPKVTWHFENEELKTDSRVSFEQSNESGVFSLIIRGIEEEDEGEYTCKAENTSGQVKCSAELSILEL